jgi:hypothetical protein
MRRKCSGLPQHRINERSLAMVYVGDDCDVAQVIALLDWQIF